MKNDDEPYRVVVADGHEIVREGIASRLAEECDVVIVGEASSGYELIKVCRNEDPDLALMALSLVRPSGMDTFLRLQEMKPELKFLLMSSEVDASNAFQALTKGAVGFMPTRASSAHFVNAVNAIILGYSCFPSELLTEFVDLSHQAPRTGNVYGLSPRELEVLHACSDGTKSRDVAEKLDISVRTVESHRNSIYRKTNCRSLEEIAKMIATAE